MMHLAQHLASVRCLVIGPDILGLYVSCTLRKTHKNIPYVFDVNLCVLEYLFANFLFSISKHCRNSFE